MHRHFGMNAPNSNANHTPPAPDALAPMRVTRQAVEAGIDPIGVATPLLHAQLAWLAHPQELAERMAHTAGLMMQLYAHGWRRAMGLAEVDPVEPAPDDTRFADPVWSDSPTWDWVKEWYLLLTHEIQDMLFDTPGLSRKERRRAAFWWRKWLNAMAPTNFLLTNPMAMRKAVESRGESLWRGYRNFLEDLRSGQVRMTSRKEFSLGVNIATTPGKVVFRNRLLEVIRYAPTTPTVAQVPLVMVTPWINKFYVLDLNAQKSMVRYLVAQGFTVFITSWKNPDASMRDVRFDDYLTEGVDTLVRVAREHCGVDKVHAAGYCIGGTALAIYMAWANRHYGGAEHNPVAHWTLLTSLVDFHRPGDIEVFIDEHSTNYLCRQMETRGYLDGREMASAFRLLRSNSLIWNYVVHGWLYGEEPPPFDVLYWNMDTTRLPYAMHSWYLRELYLNNKLIRKDALTLAGEAIDLEVIVQPLYAVAAEDDHIVPWREAYRICNFVMAAKRFVLTNSGHILGIVNPPVSPPRRRYRVDVAHRAENADTWLARAPSHEGSWWPDWVEHLRASCGPQVEPAPMETRTRKALGDAPGSYVLET